MNERTAVAVVIPVHNEAGFLPGAIEKITQQLDSVPGDISIHLIENGSTDGTYREATAAADRDARVHVLHLAQADYGGAMRAGFDAARTADWVVNFDIDYFSGPFVRDVVENGGDADIIIASKRASGSEDRRPLVRRLGTLVFNMILRFALHSGVSDTHGIKAFRGSAVDALVDEVQLNQDLFDTELVLRAERAGYRIREVPIVVEELREARSSFIKRVPRTLRGIAQLRRTLAGDPETSPSP